MLRNSRSYRSLKRRKSTSSAKDHNIDPAIAQQHARAAAVLAFTRGQKNNTDSDYSHGLSKFSFNPPQGTSDTYGRQHQSLEMVGHDIGTFDIGMAHRELRHQHSVRFVGPDAQPRKRSAAMRASYNPLSRNIRQAPSCTSLRPRALTNDVAVPAAYRPPSRSSSIGKTGIHGYAEAQIQAIEAFDEYYTNEDDLASLHSSYRRLHRSRSTRSEMKVSTMFSHDNSHGLAASFTAVTPLTEGARTCGSYEKSRLKGSKSMFFLRRLPGRSVRNDSNSDCEAVQLARDTFLHNHKQQLHDNQSSTVLQHSSVRHEKSFRKSLRDGSDGTKFRSDNSSGIPEGGLGNQNTFRQKARKVSSGFRKKIKGLFKRVEAVNDLPAQQVQSHRSHSSQLTGLDTENAPKPSPTREFATPEALTMPHVTSRVPNLRAVPSAQALSSRKGSFNSLRSERSGTSSWNEAYESTASRYTAADRERQRLSIINENGEHLSSSLRCKRARPTLTVSHEDYGQDHDSTASSDLSTRDNSGSRSVLITKNDVIREVNVINSPRVYSAFMKRLDVKSSSAKLVERTAIVDKSTDSFDRREGSKFIRVPPRTSSFDSVRRDVLNHQDTPTTIRHVGNHGNDQGIMMSNHGNRTSCLDACDQSQLTGNNVFRPVSKPSKMLNRKEAPDQAVLNTNTNRCSPARGDYSLYPSASPVLALKQKLAPSVLFRAHTVGAASGTDHGKCQDTVIRSQELCTMNSDNDFSKSTESLKANILFKGSSQGVEEAGSGMFGSGYAIIHKRQSPYRRALKESEVDVSNTTPCSNMHPSGSSLSAVAYEELRYNPAVITGDTPLRGSKRIDNGSTSDYEDALDIITHGPMAINDKHVAQENIEFEDKESIHITSKLYCESIYSRTTSGRTPMTSLVDVNTVVDTDFHPLPPNQTVNRNKEELGEAVILERIIYKPKKRTGNLTIMSSRDTSAGSTLSHKQIVTSNSWDLESRNRDKKEEKARSQSLNAHLRASSLPTSICEVSKPIFGNHKRENAQMFGSDDTELVATETARQSCHISDEIVKEKDVQHSKSNGNCLIVTPTKLTAVVSCDSNEKDEVPRVDPEGPAQVPRAPPIPPPPPPPTPKRTPIRNIRQMQSTNSLYNSGFHSTTVKLENLQSSPRVSGARSARTLPLQRSSAALHSYWSADSDLARSMPRIKLAKKRKPSHKDLGTEDSMNRDEQRGRRGKSKDLQGSRISRAYATPNHKQSPGGILRAVENQFASVHAESKYGNPKEVMDTNCNVQKSMGAIAVRNSGARGEKISPATNIQAGLDYGENPITCIGPPVMKVAVTNVVENRASGISPRVNTSPEPIQSSGPGVSQQQAQSGSQKIVDVFLSNRRRRIQGSDDSGPSNSIAFV